MIIDILENLSLYKVLQEDRMELIRDFCENALEKHKKGELEQGRTELLSDKLFALVQIYDTKSVDESVMEAHEKYLDLQYILSGEELFYIHKTVECEVLEDQTPQRDFLFLAYSEPEVRAKVSAGMFVLLYPQDAHMPCIQLEEKKEVRKVVFKILSEP